MSRPEPSPASRPLLCDAYCGYGRRPTREPSEPWTLDQLLEDMAYFGIDEALVHHFSGKHTHPARGNELIAHDLTPYPHLHAMWTAMPHHTGELPAPEAFLAEMKDAGARAVRLYPKTHNWNLSPACAGPLLEALEAHRVPTCVDFAELSGISDIISILERHPDLPLIVNDLSYRCFREMVPIWRRWRRPHCDFARMIPHGGIEWVVQNLGADVLLFGTRYPLQTPGSALACLLYAQIPDEARAEIASGAIRRLLEGVR